MNFKNFLCGALAALTVTSSLPFSAHANNVGDVIGQVLSTDIKAYIDGAELPSFNIAGRTAVVVQNLDALGHGINFGVSFDEESRILTIDGIGKQDPARESYYFDGKDYSHLPNGTAVLDVLYTDIKTNYNGIELESFNIEGFTCVYIDDLGDLCGSYSWDHINRTASVTRDPGKLQPSEPPSSQEPDSPAYPDESDVQETPSLRKIDSVEAGRILDASETVITRDETTYRWGEPATSHLTKNEDGTFTAVEVSEHINIETYDKEFNRVSSFAIKKELPIFGGLYFGTDYNYIAFGQENLLDDNSREVIKIVIYDKSFVKISEVSINNCKTAVPFDASAGEMYEDDRYLVLHTSRSQYMDENGIRPQTQLTVIIDKTTWKPCNMLGKFQYNHSSHALRELVRIDEGRLITANYSDAAPIRGAFLQELDFGGKVLHTQSVFNTGGPLGANCTGAMIGGLEVSDKGYLVSLSSIDHSLPTDYTSISIEGIEKENRDIYLLWTDKNTWEMRHTFLTSYSASGMSGSVPYLVNLQNDTFMVLWQQFADGEDDSNTVCYAFIDGDGNRIGSNHTAWGKLSANCQPVVSDGKVVWYVNTDSGRTFYNLDADPNAHPENTETPEDAETPEVPELPENTDIDMSPENSDPSDVETEDDKTPASSPSDENTNESSEDKKDDEEDDEDDDFFITIPKVD